MATIRIISHVNLSHCGLGVGSVVDVDDSDQYIQDLLSVGYVDLCPDCVLTGTCGNAGSPGSGGDVDTGGSPVDPSTLSRIALATSTTQTGLASGSTHYPHWDTTNELVGSDLAVDVDNTIIDVLTDGVYAITVTLAIAREGGGLLEYVQCLADEHHGVSSEDYWDPGLERVTRVVSFPYFFASGGSGIRPTVNVDTDNPGVTTWMIDSSCSLYVQRVA